MTVYGTIIDNQTNAPLPGASITIVNTAGTQLAGGLAADDAGYFLLTNAQLDAGAKLLISAVGYKTVMVDPAIIASSGSVGLDEDPAVLATATVTAKLPAKKTLVPLVIAGGGLLLLASTDKKKGKRMAGIGEGTDYSKYILPIGIVGAAGYLLYKLFGKGGWLTNPTGSAANNSTTASAAAQSSAATLAAETAKGNGPTISAVTAASIANSIYALGLAGGPSAAGAMNAQIDQVNNLADVALVAQYFGTKYLKMPQDSSFGLCALFDIDCTAVDFPTFFHTFSLQSDPSGSTLSSINQFFSAMGINYSF